MKEAFRLPRTKHRANRLAEQLGKQKVNVARIHGNRSQAQRTDALEGFKSGRYRVLVATDIAARGIDVEALGHVNFDVPLVPEDYIHRVGRTARAEATGDAFTFVAPNEEADLRAIEQAIGKRLPRVTVPDFDYTARATERFEVPIADRIAEIRKRKSERARAKANAERRAGHGAGGRPAGGGHGRPAGAGSGSGAGAIAVPRVRAGSLVEAGRASAVVVAAGPVAVALPAHGAAASARAGRAAARRVRGAAATPLTAGPARPAGAPRARRNVARSVVVSYRRSHRRTADATLDSVRRERLCAGHQPEPAAGCPARRRRCRTPRRQSVLQDR